MSKVKTVKSSDTLKVVNRDNRGDDKVQYGYVYFNDGTRIGYTSGKDAEIFGGNWGGNTDNHFAKAAEFLKKDGLPLS